MDFVEVTGHSVPLVFSTKTKTSMDLLTFMAETLIKQLRISQENHLILGFQNRNPQKQIFYFKLSRRWHFPAILTVGNFESLIIDAFCN